MYNHLLLPTKIKDINNNEIDNIIKDTLNNKNWTYL